MSTEHQSNARQEQVQDKDLQLEGGNDEKSSSHAVDGGGNDGGDPSEWNEYSNLKDKIE